jgi:ubiquinone/menaquinone biosynthesis C-methylase UbiE
VTKPKIKIGKETSWADEASLEYHIKQYDQVKESTKAFLRFIQEGVETSLDGRLVDLGCGAGAATSYISSKLNRSETIGIDSSPELIDIANSHSSQNTSYEVGDFMNLQKKDEINGVYSIHTLMCLSEFENPVEQVLLKLKPNWFAISSLFYLGEISATTLITENNKQRSVFYNTYSIPEVDRFVRKFGYKVSKYENFEIPFDIPQNGNIDALGTYTMKTSEPGGPKRIQISGPVLMNWYFVLIQKID